MDSLSWLSTLASHEAGDEPEAADAPVSLTDANKTSKKETEAVEKMSHDQEAIESLCSMGFSRAAVEAALRAAGGDDVEALARLSAEVSASKEATSRKRQRSESGASESLAAEATDDGETLEVEGVCCALTDAGELVLRLPGDSKLLGPVVGHQKSGGGIVFDGMNDWLWELYEGHKPRPADLPPSFDIDAAAAAMDAGAPYIWEDFATEADIKAANTALESMFSSKELARGSSSWVDECAEGGHARNRRALEGSRRDDACGFWDLQGGKPEQPAPPEPVMLLFRRLEAAAERLREKFGWPLLCSRQGMGAVYDGQGACYSQHRDNEWQRHLKPRRPKPVKASSRDEQSSKSQRSSEVSEPGAWMCFRELTMLAYVNLPEDFGDETQVGRKNGGRLRCYNKTRKGDLTGDTATELVDVAPVGGRAVIFRSRELLHEVLPSFGRRYCLTLWFCTPYDSD
eukprot:TRINITY_DN19704_c0_g1_i1.p1 TRINITY_DN19704_c0_g1~~TRINITY_DN19704_c0_g1_i1.p1  ORF type:complete len:458 (+),score=97.89 TRINITY_DN19704_c0_g1_i1:38-1411(+)